MLMSLVTCLKGADGSLLYEGPSHGSLFGWAANKATATAISTTFTAVATVAPTNPAAVAPAAVAPAAVGPATGASTTVAPTPSSGFAVLRDPFQRAS